MKKLLLAILAMVLVSITVVSAAGDLAVTVDPVNGNPGDVVTVAVQVENTGATDMASVTLTSTELTDGVDTLGTPDVPDITNLLAGTPQEVTFDITIPAMSATTLMADITAIDDADANNTDIQQLDFTVNAVDAFEVSHESISLDGIAGDSLDEDIRVTNTGSTTLSSWTLTLDNFADGDGDVVTMSLNGQTSLAPGEYFDLTVYADVDEDVDVDTYSGTLTLASGFATQDVSVSVEVEPGICEYGKQGNNLDIDIKEPDSGDDYGPGDIINIEVDVTNDDNDDHDFKVVAYLYNMDEDRVIESVKSDYIEIGDNDEETFSLELEVPLDDDWDESDEYYLYVKAFEKGEEDNNCNYERISLDLERETHEVIFENIEVTPSEDLECGDEYEMVVEIINVGNDDEDDVYIRILDGDLDLDEQSAYFDLENYDDSDNNRREEFTFTVPEDLDEGTYYIEVLVYYDDGDDYTSEIVAINLDLCPALQTVDPFLDVVADDFEAFVGDEVTVPVTITNNGEYSTNMVLTAEDTGDFVEVLSYEYLSALESGQSTTAYVYLDVNDAVGVHDFTIKVADDYDNEITEVVQVTINEVPIEESALDALTGAFAGANTSAIWLLGNVLLFAIVVVLLIALMRKK